VSPARRVGARAKAKRAAGRSGAAARSRGLHFIGSHTVYNGGIDMAVRRAANAGMSAVQIFTAVPKYYNDRMSIRPERVERFRRALAETGISPSMVLVHAPYVLSVATPDPAKWQRASAGLARELERSTALGAGGLCFHPGAAGNSDRTAAAERVGRAIVAALESMDSSTRVLVENTAGAGTTMGRTPAEIGAILGHVPAALRQRTGYGLDTCHLFSYGFDLRESRGALTALLDEFETATGESPAFFHLNDSEFPLGSNRDRHVLIGDGHIGVEPFHWLLRDARSIGIPLILETPQLNYDIADDDASADAYDVRMLAVLTG
jgi:deoxyribonuclease-4